MNICGCGPNSATLHYVVNDSYIRDGQMILTDQGHSVQHYISDITITYPINGKFTQKQREIYSLVLKANREVMATAKPGSNWLDMHKLAERIILTGLKELGLISGDIDDLCEKRVGFLFMPHGLGHFYGLDTHDVGGYLAHTPERSTLPGLKNVRTARTLEKDQCVTIEPGCYFRDFLLEEDLPGITIDRSCLNIEKIKEYQKEIAGVRIEDCCVVREDHLENLSSMLPRTCEEIEACMRGEDWEKKCQ